MGHYLHIADLHTKRYVSNFKTFSNDSLAFQTVVVEHAAAAHADCSRTCIPSDSGGLGSTGGGTDGFDRGCEGSPYWDGGGVT